MIGNDITLARYMGWNNITLHQYIAVFTIVIKYNTAWENIDILQYHILWYMAIYCNVYCLNVVSIQW